MSKPPLRRRARESTSASLARVTPTVANIGDKTKWEFYAGGHGSAAKWVSGDVAQATPLVEFANHTGCTTMTFFPAIKKYVMTINTASNYPVMDGGDFDTWMLEVRSLSVCCAKVLIASLYAILLLAAWTGCLTVLWCDVTG